MRDNVGIMKDFNSLIMKIQVKPKRNNTAAACQYLSWVGIGFKFLYQLHKAIELDLKLGGEEIDSAYWKPYMISCANGQPILFLKQLAVVSVSEYFRELGCQTAKKKKEKKDWTSSHGFKWMENVWITLLWRSLQNWEPTYDQLSLYVTIEPA